jgi:hypothetical protein
LEEGLIDLGDPVVGEWFSVIIVSLVLGSFVFTFIRKNSRLDREKGKKHIYTDNMCGGVLGHLGTCVFSIPLVRVSVYEDLIGSAKADKLKAVIEAQMEKYRCVEDKGIDKVF